MADITVETLRKYIFIVTVSDGMGIGIQHKVTFTNSYWKKLSEREISKGDCIKKAFRFLLHNEPKEGIMREFDMTIIKEYFQTFEEGFMRF